MEIGPAVCSGEYPGMKNGGATYNMSQPVITTTITIFFITMTIELYWRFSSSSIKIF